MSNEDVKVEDIEEGNESIPEIEDSDTTDWKAEALKAQETARQQAGIAKRNATRLKKLREQQSPIEKKTDKSEPDYAKLAFLSSKGINLQEDVDWTQGVAKESGKNLAELLDTKWFQAELKERAELRISKDAIPNGSKRSVNSTRDSVEYWIAKGELPPADQRELRGKVITEKRRLAQSNSQFTDVPFI